MDKYNNRNAQRVENDQIVSTQNSTSRSTRERKERLNPSREKNKGTHRRKKVDEKSCVTFLLCDSGWCVQQT